MEPALVITLVSGGFLLQNSHEDVVDVTAIDCSAASEIRLISR